MKGFFICWILFCGSLLAQPSAHDEGFGRSRAVLIACDQYQDPMLKSLTTAVADCTALKEVLEQYGFTDTITLFNESATVAKISQTLQALVETSKDTDSVFIYFAGHRARDKSDTWNWLVSDSVELMEETHFKYSFIESYLKSMPAKHTLVVDDSCHRITAFNEKSRTLNSQNVYEEHYAFAERQDISLPLYEERIVTDKDENHSIFARFLVENLCPQVNGYITLNQLLSKINPRIETKNSQKPMQSLPPLTIAVGNSFPFFNRSHPDGEVGGSLPTYGTLVLSSSAGGLLSVDGFPIQQLEGDEIAEFEGIPAGPHEIMFQALGFQELRETVLVQPDQFVVRSYEPKGIKDQVNPNIEKAIDLCLGRKGKIKPVKSVELFKKEWAKGDARAKMWMARFLSKDRYGIKRNDNLAQVLGRAATVEIDALAKKGDKVSALILANFSLQHGNPLQTPQEALSVIQGLANEGFPSAQLSLGILYRDGGPIKEDKKEAVKWIRLAADQGYAPAQSYLAWLYIKGSIVDQNYQEAEKWFKLAAEQEDAYAQNYLGILYRDGNVVPHDGKGAMEMFRLAADQQYAESQVNLGMMYAEGNTIPQDYKQAMKWLGLASAQGHGKAKEKLQSVFKYPRDREMEYPDTKDGLKYGSLIFSSIEGGNLLFNGKPLIYLSHSSDFPFALKHIPPGPYEVIFQRDDGSQIIEMVQIRPEEIVTLNFPKQAEKGPNPIIEEAFDFFYGRKGKINWARSKALFEQAWAQEDALARLWIAWSMKQGKYGYIKDNWLVPAIGDDEYRPARSRAEKGEKIWAFLLEEDQLRRTSQSWVVKQSLEKIQGLANEGFALAQNHIGKAYESGEGFTQDHQEALRWYRLAADQACALAQANLAAMYRDGIGVPQDYMEGFKWFRLAANQGYPPAQSALAVMYRDGLGVPQDYKQAMKWFKLAADQGHAGAQYFLGCMYGYGNGVPQNYIEALKWLTKASDLGHEEAKRNLALCQFRKHKGLGLEGGVATVQEQFYPLTLSSSVGGLLFVDGQPIQQLIPKSKFELRGIPAGSHKITIKAIGYEEIHDTIQVKPNQSLERTYHPKGFDNITKKTLEDAIDLYYGNKGRVDWRQAKILFDDASAKGDIPAKAWIAVLMFRGYCGYKKNELQAQILATQAYEGLRSLVNKENEMNLYLLALCAGAGLGTDENPQEDLRLTQDLANGGMAMAQHHLAYLYKNGIGLPRDEQEAIKWCRLAADQGLAMAQGSLANMYFSGNGVPQDYKQALQYYRLSADQGYVFSQNGIGIIYRNGYDVPKDHKEAVKWFQLAADQGFAEAQYHLGSMYHKGLGVAQSLHEAFKWYQLAADQDHQKAKNEMVLFYRNPPPQIGTVVLSSSGGGLLSVDGKPIRQFQPNEIELLELKRGWHEVVLQSPYYADIRQKIYVNPNTSQTLALAPEKYASNANEMVERAIDLFYGRKGWVDRVKATILFEKAANLGEQRAQMWVARLWAQGHCLTINGPSAEEMAASVSKKVRSLGDKGDKFCAFLWSLSLLDGLGTKQNQAEGLRLIRELANNGLALAQHQLGTMYQNGAGLPQDSIEALKWFRLAAEQGFAPAQDAMGSSYLRGLGVPMDYKEALNWFRLAANQKYESALVNMGLMYDNGTGVARDHDEADKWYKFADDHRGGDLRANLRLGRQNKHDPWRIRPWKGEKVNPYGLLKLSTTAGGSLFVDGKFTQQFLPNVSETIENFPVGTHILIFQTPGFADVRDTVLIQPKELLERSYHPGKLGGRDEETLENALDLFYGRDVLIDWSKAKSLIEQAAMKGDIRANMWIACFIFRGDFGYKKDETFARNMAMPVSKEIESLACKGDEQSKILWSHALMEGLGTNKNPQEGFKLIEDLANNGLAMSQHYFGDFYANGKGPTLDSQIVQKWYRLAADQGWALSQNNLAAMYYQGKGVPKDSQEAAKWYRLAADQQHPSAQFNLGTLYYKGNGVPQDYQEALKWFNLAAVQAYEPALYNLAKMYDDGIGVTKDYNQAIKWYQLAADQGNDDAKSRLDILEMEVNKSMVLQSRQPSVDGQQANLGVSATTWEQFGTLVLSSAPGGSLFIDGKAIQQLQPMEQGKLENFPAGTHEVVIQAIGYADIRDTVLLQPKQTLERSYQPAVLGAEAKETLEKALDLYFGRKGLVDWVNAKTLFEQAAALGDIRAKGWVARLVFLGNAFKKDKTIARNMAASVSKEIEAWSKTGDKLCTFLLAESLLYGIGTDQNEQEGLRLMQALANDGEVFAQNYLGILYQYGIALQKDHQEAFKWYKIAAAQGFVVAQANLASMYKSGSGIVVDYNEVIKWNTLAAEQGYWKAQYSLAKLYSRGDAFPPDDEKAIKWFTRTAEQGIGDAQYALAQIYKNGTGIQQDLDEAFKWFQLAADQGIWDAQLALGVLYERGLGCEKNLEAAIICYQKAARHGDKTSKLHLQRLGIK